ncbi:MAG: ABC transporter permease [Treponema sp.]
MFLLKTAFANIFFHKKRSLLSILLIAVASSTILLYKGYVEYSERGLALSFIENSGHIQVACKDFWDGKIENNKLLTASDIDTLEEYFFSVSKIEKVDAILNFQGIIGTENSSKIFWGIAYDEPHELGVTEGIPVFEEDNSLVLGVGLFNALDINFKNNNIVNLMTTISSNEINSGSFEVSGYIDSGVSQNDAGFVIASRHALLDFFELDNVASCIRIYLEDEKDVKQIQKLFNSYFEKNNLVFETRDWKTLNPTWAQISSLFNTQFSVISFILCILIFVSLTQSIGASFMERLSEFGTMEAIGLNKISLIFSLIMEVLLLSLLGVVLGILFSYLGNSIAETFNITMTPPGYSKGFPLRFFITTTSIFKTQFFILLTCLIATLQPIYTIGRLTTARLMHYSEK